jgi:uracil-DNA glycosylase
MKTPESTGSARPRRARSSPAVSDPEATGSRVIHSIGELREAVNACRRCDLWRHATQGVPGEGNAPVHFMFVGEAPGDGEDIAGHPFVGPAGAVLDKALHEAGIDRDDVYISNAVKHFKFEQRGKRRLHVKPSIGEIKACHWWFEQEIRLVQPKLILALGATAARAVLGRAVTVGSVRGSAIPISESMHLWVTVHPSYLLRIPEEAVRRVEFLRFVQELKDAKAWLKKASTS